MNKALVFLLVVLILVPGGAALGISPSSKELVLGVDREEFTLRIINMNNEEFTARFRVEGDLAEYVTLSKSEVSFDRAKEMESIQVMLNIPSGVELEEGEHTTRITLTQEREGSDQVTARLGLTFRLTVIVPYSGAFITTSLYAPNIERGKSGNFILQAMNRGTENAIGVTPVIDIYTPGQERIATLVGERRTIPVGEQINFVLPLKDELPNGRYVARAIIIYEGRTSSDEKTFTVGSPELEIDTISTTEFRLGGIAGFNILVSSNWGERISNVYADVEFREGNNLLERTRTAATNIDGLGRAILNAYWDTSGLRTGTYEMTISINFLDKVHARKYDVILEHDRVRVVGVGQVVTPGEDDLFGGAGTLVIIIFILVLLNAVLVYKFVIKKKK